ncbi:cysteine desulfurase [Vibrio parahaemolyticus]|nr:cysteine desulfurase [Vibrio parahaemolyticus]
MYLDYLATTPISQEALQLMTEVFQNCYGNPSSIHVHGDASRELLRQSQETIADIVGAEPSEIIFTSGATESNNLAIKGLARLNENKGKHLITSEVEHSCILNIFHYLESQGFDVTYLKPESSGGISPDAVRHAMRPDTTLVSIMHVNNELGSINPIAEIGEICFNNGISFHTDAAQSVGKLDIDVVDYYVDALSASGHKFFGPKGIGFLYLRDARNLDLEPILHGSGQQMGLRGGTIPTPLIAGMAKALETFHYDKSHMAQLRKLFFKILDEGQISYKINGKDTLENVINLTFERAEDFTIYTSQPSICISQGSACNSKNVTPSHVLKSLGLTAEESFRTVRISFYDDTLLTSARIFN